MKHRICIIAARGGSKRLPGKNIMPFCGRPLIAHSIEQAKETGLFTSIVASSDDNEILSIARRYGVDLAIERPPELATDEASSLDVIKHAVNYTETELGFDYKSIVFLQVTSPLRLPDDIKKAVEIFESQPASNLLSVVKNNDFSIEIANGKTAASVNFGKEKYELNGSIYIWDKDKFISDPRHIYNDTKLMAMPKNRSIDIDYATDFKNAEIIMQQNIHLAGTSEAIN